ncbi:MAG: hypothetical protein C0483_23900 [Pirellula sp.]|nr:hypothetical protein [Pirellula sp.]
MPEETSFRIAVLVVTLGAGLGGAYFRIQARSDETITHEAEGRMFALVLRLFGLALWLSTLAYLIAPQSIAWAAVPIPRAIRWCAVAVAALSAGGFVRSLVALGKNLTDTVVTRRDARLVTAGPYAWVRHPFYTTAFLLMASVAAASANLLPAACVVGVITMLILRTRQEEERLIAAFGDDYREYMRTTGRFLPRVFPRRSS